MRIYKEIIINAPVKKVWRVFSELEKWPKWGGYVLDACWTSGKKWALNSTFKQVMKGVYPIKKINSNPQIIKIKPGAYATWEGRRKLLKGVHTFKFEGINKKTKVANIEHFKGPLAPVIFPFIKHKFEKYFWQFLNGLKREAEKR
ncbi:SRPBCC family protein [Candidatus Woesearchaeota archaeon]|nr:SRPBCC family protein [Candidatus Woesearchaeota archaeon]